MLRVVPPSNFEEKEIQKIMHMRAKKEKSAGTAPLENISSRSIFWMPYYRIQFEYERSEENVINEFGKTAESETVINAMFCDCAQSENELLALFRPNYMKYKMIRYAPQLNEVIAPTCPADFDAILTGFLQRLNAVENELHELRSKLNKSYTHARRYSLILPTMGGLKESEKLSEKIAKLDALASVFRILLNLNEDAKSIKTLRNSTFYYPVAVGAFEKKESEVQRQFVIIDLVKKGSIHKSLSCDDLLTQLCNKNDACNKILAESLDLH